MIKTHHEKKYIYNLDIYVSALFNTCNISVYKVNHKDNVLIESGAIASTLYLFVPDVLRVGRHRLDLAPTTFVTDVTANWRQHCGVCHRPTCTWESSRKEN